MSSRRETDWPFITDALRELPQMSERRMFGCLAFYRDGLLTLVLTGEGDEPWNGVLVATDRTRHAALVAAFPELVAHPVLGKWLYVSCAASAFERVAEGLVGLVASRDARVGVAPKPSRAHRAKSRSR